MPDISSSTPRKQALLMLKNTSDTSLQEWRHEGVAAFHDKLALHLGVMPGKVLPDEWWEQPDIAPFGAELTELLQHNPPFCVIDTRTELFFPLWQKVLGRLEMTPLWVVSPEEYNRMGAELNNIRGAFAMVMESTSWKVTMPLRIAKQLAQAGRNLMPLMLKPSSYSRAWKLLRNYGVRKMCKKLIMVLKTQGLSGISYYLNRNITYEVQSYEQWVETHDTLSDNDKKAILRHIADFPTKPLISVIMPVYNVEPAWLKEAIDSVLRQLYPHWELCIADDCSTNPAIARLLNEYAKKDKRIKLVLRTENGHISACSNSALAMAGGEFIALFDHDDLLAEHALYHVAYEINKHPELDLLYSDEDKINAVGERFGPYFKSAWNPDLFYSQNMFNHLGVYRRSLVEKVGGFRSEFDGSQDYDLCLRCVKQTSPEKIRHIPHILYHWRAIPGSTALAGASKNYAAEASRRAITEFFAEVNPEVTIKDAPVNHYHRICWPVPSPAPGVTLIIPTRNAYGLLSKCVESIRAITDYPNYDIIIMNNQSDDKETLDYFAHLKATAPNVRVIDYDAPFNFSSINNFAVGHITNPLIGFINNDIEAIHADWLHEMVGHALREEIGAVGAKLYYPNNTIQHAGVITGVGVPQDAVAGHFFHGLPKDELGYFGRAMLTQSLSGVTAACIIMRKNVFLEVGKFEEKHLSVAFNDVDLCLKIREHGYRIIWTPYAELYHHESATRGYEDTPEKFARFRKEVAYMRQRWGDVLDNDPYYNPNLDLMRGDYSLAFPSRAVKPWLVWQGG